jgi:ABC-type multidrug transport system ATPase subunit
VNALEFKGVVKNYGRSRALSGLDLAVPAGTIFGLIGANGAGKTTALAAAAGLLRIQAGSINLLGEGPFDPARHAGRVSLLPQDSRLPQHSRVEELLLYYGRLQGLKEGPLRESVDSVLDWVHLADRRRSAVRTLSHGMARRLTIAQAFLGHPELVLLDEPMSGLDPREASRIRHMLMRRRDTRTVVVSSHDLRELEQMCSHAVFIDRGRVVREGTMDSLTRRGRSTVYTLAGGAVPLDALGAAAPDATFELKGDGTGLKASFAGGGNEAELNARVLRVLLDAGVGIIGVSRGSGLENEYLSATEQAPPPSGDLR